MTTAVLKVTDFAGGNGASEVGGAAETTLDDGSDATYVRWDTTTVLDGSAGFTLGTFTLGTGRLKAVTITSRTQGSVTKQIRWYLSPSGIALHALYPSVGTWSGQTSPAIVPPNWTQAEIDALGVFVRTEYGLNVSNYVSQLSVNVTYAVAPVANITYPTASPAIASTSSPVITWTHTAGSDGGPQTYYELKVFTAAQYGAGGFSADTSTPEYTSGIVASGATSKAAGPLPNSTTYRVYVRTAQTINGTPHWSSWDYEAFSTNYTTSNITSVVGTPNNTTGAITVVVTRNGATAAWSEVFVERSNNGGTTWSLVRGGDGASVADGTYVTAFSTSAMTIIDYEAPNGQTVTYRARASTMASGSEVIGPYTTSSTTSWTSTSTFLKDVYVPSRNTTIRFATMPNAEYGRTASEGIVAMRADPVVVVDVRQKARGSMVIHTPTAAAAATLRTLFESSAWAIHAPASHGVGDPEATGAGGTTLYCVPLQVTQIRAVRNAKGPHRYWQVTYVQIGVPVDDVAYA